MFTKPELIALQSPLSNAARVLYCLGLRPFANLLSARSQPLQYKPLLALLNEGESEKPIYHRGRQINQLLKQLEHVGLVTLPSDVTFEQSLNNVVLILPLCHTEQSKFDHLHTERKPIHLGWQPDGALFDELASLIGLSNTNYTQQDVGEFVAYWLGRPSTQHTGYQWTQKFTQMIKRKYPSTVTALSSETTNNVAAIAVDDNARKLVERFHRKK